MGVVVRAWGLYHVDMLNTIIHGDPTDEPPLVIAHGLYGSARNWGVIARRLSDERQVIAVDMRNHAYSFWDPYHDYTDLAQDLAEVVDSLGGQADVVGHSMGGKAAMMLALRHSSLVRKLVVADIAPVAYSHTQIQFIEAMRAVDLARVSRRSEAETQLAALGVEKALQSFFTQSLDVEGQRWRLNLDVLADQMPQIMGFPKWLQLGPALRCFYPVRPLIMCCPNTETRSERCSPTRDSQKYWAQDIGCTLKNRVSSKLRSEPS